MTNMGVKVNPLPKPEGMNSYDDGEDLPWYGPGGIVEQKYNSIPSQLFFAALLFIALFATDVRDATLGPDSGDSGLEGVLFTILILFFLEIVLCVVVVKDYLWSFFFWMDLIGTVSLIFDIPWMTPGFNQTNSAVLRASRASRIGSRAARLTKLIRLIKVVRIMRLLKYIFKKAGAEEAQDESATGISSKISMLVSKRVAMVVMLTILVVPLLSTDLFDNSMNAFLSSFSTKNTSEVTWTELDNFFEFFDSSAGDQPYMLRVGDVTGNKKYSSCWDDVWDRTRGNRPAKISLEAMCTCMVGTSSRHTPGSNEYVRCIIPAAAPLSGAVTSLAAQDTYIWLREDLVGNQRRKLVSRVSLSPEEDNPMTELMANVSYSAQWSGIFNVILVFFVIFVLVGFTMTTFSSLDKMVIQSLENIFRLVNDTMSEFMTRGKQGRNMDMAELEGAVNKLTKLGEHVTATRKKGGHKAVNDILSDDSIADDHKAWLTANYTTDAQHGSKDKDGAIGHRLSVYGSGGSDRDGPNKRLTIQKGNLHGHGNGKVKNQLPQLNRVSEDAKGAEGDLEQGGGGHGGTGGTGEGVSSDSVVSLPLLSEKGMSSAAMVRVDASVVETFDFDVLQHSRAPNGALEPARLFPHIAWMFESTGSLEEFGVDGHVCHNFLAGVASRYHHENPYHNFFHAADVMQTLYMFVRANNGVAILSPVDIFAALVGALAHDLNHPGVNANFLTNTRHELAMTYNDTSILENMHISTLYKVLAEEACDMFANLNDMEWKEARKVIIGSVIATDMSHHFTMVSEMDVFYEMNEPALTGSSEQRSRLFENQKNRQFLLNTWMHAADISNPCKNFDICSKWAKVVMQEFFSQGDQEKKLGMPVSPGFDSATTSTPTMQVNFIEFVVGPLYEKLIKISPELMELGIQIVHNRRVWGEQMLVEIEAKQKLSTDVMAAAAEGVPTPMEVDIKKNADRLARFEKSFGFVFERQEQLRSSDPDRVASVPGARPLNFTGSMGPKQTSPGII